jgi:hypothetical protein
MVHQQIIWGMEARQGPAGIFTFTGATYYVMSSLEWFARIDGSKMASSGKTQTDRLFMCDPSIH